MTVRSSAMPTSAVSTNATGSATTTYQLIHWGAMLLKSNCTTYVE